MDSCHLDTGLNDLGRLIFIGANADIKQLHLDDWIQLYYDAFERGTKEYGVENPYSLELAREMFAYHYASELSFTLMILGLECQKVTDEKVRDLLIERMISSFEPIRGKYE